MGANKKNLKKRPTFEEVLNKIKEDKPVIHGLPNRFSTPLRDSRTYQNLIPDDLTAIEEHANRIAKHNLLEREIKHDTGKFIRKSPSGQSTSRSRK